MVKCLLSSLEYLIYPQMGIKLLVQRGRIPFIRQCQLVLQIAEFVVDRRRREHQNLGFNTRPNHLVHQRLIARFLFLVGLVVTEVVRLVNHYQIIITPVHPAKRHAQGLAFGALQVGMTKHIKVEAIFNKWIGREVAVVVGPVLRQLFRA